MRLRERGLPYYRLNSDDLASTTVSIEIDNARVRRVLSCGRVSLNLDAVRSVWYRRAIRPSRPHAIAPDFHSFAISELRHLYEGVLADLPVRWVNPLDLTDLAERKVFQLRLAAKSGLTIPRTIISNDLALLRSFADEHHRLICKPISQGLVSTVDRWFAVHTREVSLSDLTQARCSTVLPTLLQYLVPKGVDIRLTVIGDDVYPVEVHTPGNGPIDWRAASESVTYKVCSVPAQVERACRRLMNALGLSYGAFDFIRTEAGEWFFLEVNPAGEWAWLEVELNLPMRDSFIRLLYGT